MSDPIRTLSVILPTYNERENIGPLVDELLRFGGEAVEVIIVDDASPDGTAALVQERYGDRPSVRLIVRTDDRGLAKSIRAGLEAASGDGVIVMDTDFNHDPAMLPLIRELLGHFDIVVGSRFVVGGGMEDVFRYYASWAYNIGLRTVLGTRIQDNLSGFFGMRREHLPSFDRDAIFYGYGDYFFRLLHEATSLQLRMIEIPVYYRLRPAGESKTRYLKIFTDYTSALLSLVRQRGIKRRRPAPLPRR